MLSVCCTTTKGQGSLYYSTFRIITRLEEENITFLNNENMINITLEFSLHNATAECVSVEQALFGFSRSVLFLVKNNKKSTM